MLGSVSHAPTARTLEFGIYRDGDNNLDDIQANVISQALEVSANNRGIEFSIEDTTARRGFAPSHVLRTESYAIADGKPGHRIELAPPHDMSDRQNLARFVAQTLDRAQANGAKQTWMELVDHGAGDGGGLQSDHGQGIMRADDMAGAIADGVALHAREHPEDAARRVDGVVANECLMASLGFEAALSHAGVGYLAASPETMLAPGVPTSVADPIARLERRPHAMAQAVVDRVMQTEYALGTGVRFGPAAAFDVLDLAPDKMARVEDGVRQLDATLLQASQQRGVRAAIREDAKAIDGMVRFRGSAGMPWHADRPALALYDALASDGRLPASVRDAAKRASQAVAATVLAHAESDGYAPFGSDYSDAAGPTVHFPVTPRQIDPWAPQVSETDNAFYKSVGAADLANALALASGSLGAGGGIRAEAALA
jgi:hypothetical protein